MEKRTFTLPQEELPRAWYNVLADLDRPLDPPLDPRTQEPMPPEALTALFPKACVEQEVATDRFIDIPEEVLEVYRLWRPTPLYRALNLERVLGTPAHIYYKYEGASPTGSHKTNTAVAQAYYTTRRRGPSASPPRPGPASGGAPWPSPARRWAWSSPCSWSRSPTSRSPIGRR